MKWLKRLFESKSPVNYRLMGAVDRKSEEEIKVQIWRKLRRRLKDGK